MNFPQPGPSPGPSLTITAQARWRKPSILLCAKTRQAETVGNGPERTFQVWQESSPLVWQEMGYCLSQWPAGIPRALLGRRKRPCVSYFSLCPLSLSGVPGAADTARGWCMHSGAGFHRHCCVCSYGVIPSGFCPLCFSSGWAGYLGSASGRVVVCCLGWVGLFCHGWAAEGKSLPFTESQNGLGSVRKNL